MQLILVNQGVPLDADPIWKINDSWVVIVTLKCVHRRHGDRCVHGSVGEFYPIRSDQSLVDLIVGGVEN
jgi:hypothetical protein